MDEIMQLSLDLALLLIVMSAIASATITFIISRRSVGRQATDIANLTAEVASFRQSSGQSVAELRAKDDTISDLRREASETADQLRELRTEHSDMRVALAESNANLASEREQAQQKIALINEAKEQLSNQFKALASEIFEDKSKRFTEQNQVNLGQLLSPLKQQLTDFKTKVEEVYVNEGKDRSALGEQVRHPSLLRDVFDFRVRGASQYLLIQSVGYQFAHRVSVVPRL
jgi:DNA anti-recombination protein RmuC